MSDMLVSVIVPVYNAGRFLNRTIESVLRQSHDKFELILVNDGSTDNSKAICDEYASTDNRIKVVSQDNHGPAAARNVGIHHAAGDFMFFLDADDFIRPDTLETLVTQYKQRRPDLVMANFDKLEVSGKIIGQSVSLRPSAPPFTKEYMVLAKADIPAYVRHFLRHPSNHLVSYCWGRLYKSSIIKNNGLRFNENMRLFEDFVFNLDYMKRTNEIVFVNRALYTYVMHDDHVSASMAIINGESLLRDMNVFAAGAGEFFRLTSANEISASDTRKDVGHALVHYVIIFLLRSCRQIDRSNKGEIYGEIAKIVKAPILRDSLRHYSPGKGNSRVLPWLMGFGLVAPIMFVSRRKAYKRYGRPNC